MQERSSKIKTLGLLEIRPYLKLLNSNLLEFVCQVQKDHGDFTHLKIPFFNLMVISDPEWVQLLMTSLHSNLQKPDFLKKTAKAYGSTGPFIDDGEKWKEERTFFSSLFHKQTFDSYMGIREAIIFKIDQMILENPKQKPVHFFSSLSLDLIFNYGYQFTSTEFDEDIIELFYEVHDLFLKDLKRPFRLPQWVLTPHNLRAKKNNARFQKNIDKAIQHIKKIRPESSLRDELTTIFVAGMEATSAMLSWCLYGLLENPEVKDLLLESIEKESEKASSSKIQAFMDEVTRLYPPGYIFNRQVNTEFTHENIKFPKKTQLFMVPYLVHRNPSIFKDPLTFKWDRFLNWNSKAHMPYGAGARYCPGAQFARLIATLCLKHILVNYNFKNVSSETVKPSPYLSLSPGFNFECAFEPKNAQSQPL
ncbi:MAG: cytochrome P450 [Bdellovibrionota bacterium]|nr:cytochrome P450 [Bdellovibrionota bacterium]